MVSIEGVYGEAPPPPPGFRDLPDKDQSYLRRSDLLWISNVSKSSNDPVEILRAACGNPTEVREESDRSPMEIASVMPQKSCRSPTETL